MFLAVQALVEEIWPGIGRAILYGSSLTGLDLPFSDVDIVVLIEGTGPSSNKCGTKAHSKSSSLDVFTTAVPDENRFDCGTELSPFELLAKALRSLPGFLHAETIWTCPTPVIKLRLNATMLPEFDDAESFRGDFSEGLSGTAEGAEGHFGQTDERGSIVNIDISIGGAAHRGLESSLFIKNMVELYPEVNRKHNKHLEESSSLSTHTFQRS